MHNAFDDLPPEARLRRLSDRVAALHERLDRARRPRQLPLPNFWALEDVELLLQLADAHEPAICSHLEEIALKILEQREAQDARDRSLPMSPMDRTCVRVVRRRSKEEGE